MAKEKQSKRKKSVDRDRFYVQLDRWPDFQRLGQGGSAPFGTMKDVFVVSAALGFRAGTRRPFKGERKDVGFWRSFSPQEDVPLLQAIAVADTGNVDVLSDQSEILTIAEQYANEGIDLLVDMERADRDGTLRAIAAAAAQAQG